MNNNKIKQNVKTILDTKYQLFYSFTNSNIKHEIELNTYWLSDAEKEEVFKIAYKENLKQMKAINSYNISKGEKPLYCDIILVKSQLIIQDDKLKKDIKILESTLLNSNKEEVELIV